MISNGLTSLEAKLKLKQWGYNEIATSHASAFFEDIVKIFLDPMGLMLLSLAGLYWFLGDKTDSIILLIAFIPVTAIDVILSIQSSKALKALRGTLAVNAKVLRDGKIRDVPIRELVPDDVLVFEEGQTLPADGLIIESDNLNISEAALTGESVPIAKVANEVFYGGTSVLSGRGLGVIQKTGQYSRYGVIATLISNTQEAKSPLRKTVDQLVKVVLIIAFIIAGILFIFEWNSTKEFVPSLISALTLGMSAVPEEFPLVFTLYLSLGAWRLSQKKVLVKSLPSVEALGGVDIVCTDKTGTLTEGVFILEEIRKIGDVFSEKELWQFAIMSCEVHAIDSMEVPIIEKGKEYLSLLNDWSLTIDNLFDQKTKTMSHIWKNNQTNDELLAMKGAAEGVLGYCDEDQESKANIKDTLNMLANQGKRVLGLAGKKIISTGNRSIDQSNLKFIGFIVYSDPVRANVKEAILECQNAGIQVKMLTGDHILTAHSIADQIGLIHSHELLFSGDEISRMSSNDRTKAYLEGGVFARVSPEQKHEMVKILQENGKVVAMTGDGINDAPALRLADIGISMGKSATDVARSTAKMILLENNFSGIVDSIFEGRKIFSNLRRSFSYLISFHIPVILLALIPPFIHWPSILLPVHIIILELIVHPISAFTFENIAPLRNQKNSQRSILTRNQILFACISGILLSLGTLLLFYYEMNSNVERARAFAFATVLFGNIFFVVSKIFPLLNFRFYITSLALIFVIFLFTMMNVLSKYLHFEAISISQAFLALLIAMLAIIPELFVQLKK
jgi:Ca2+-transporting ATPase